MKNQLQRIFHFFGLELHRKEGKGSLEWALHTLKRQGIHPEVIIDGGAAKGEWTKRVQKIFPSAQYILVEPLAEHYPLLESVPHAQLIRGALSNMHGEANFYVVNQWNSTLVADLPASDTRKVETYTVNELLPKNKSVFLKLDLEGGEMPVLRAIDFTNIVCVLLECVFYSPTKRPFLFAELCAFMKSKGYIIQDLCSISYMPDGQLQQTDALFVKEKL